MKKNRKIYNFTCENCKKPAESCSHGMTSETTYHYKIKCTCNLCEHKQLVLIKKKVMDNPPIPPNAWSIEDHAARKPHETPPPKTTPK